MIILNEIKREVNVVEMEHELLCNISFDWEWVKLTLIGNLYEKSSQSTITTSG